MCKEGVVVNIHVTLNSGYIDPLCVMFKSMCVSNPQTKFDIYVAYSSLTDEDFRKIDNCINDNMTIHPILVDESVFDGARILERISKETYYRLLVGTILPEEVDRILYLDPDIVVINPLDEFYNLDFKGKIVAGAPHTYGVVEMVNFRRLGMTRHRHEHYINAGVLLIDVNAWRKKITTEEIIKFVDSNFKRLKLCDQDAINILFRKDILYVDEKKYNLDEKTFAHHIWCLRMNHKWLVENTVIVHFNGKKKPWGEGEYKGRLGCYFEKYR